LCEADSSRESLGRECLNSIGISLLIDWDILIFLHQHGRILSTTEQMARLLGWDSERIGNALDRLESRELIKFSRKSRGGARFYKAAVSDSAAYNCFQQLLSLTRNRSGRLMLAKMLKPNIWNGSQAAICRPTFREDVPNGRKQFDQNRYQGTR
jgi:DNA-binding MarR family transcriptional regulator